MGYSKLSAVSVYSARSASCLLTTRKYTQPSPCTLVAEGTATEQVTLLLLFPNSVFFHFCAQKSYILISRAELLVWQGVGVEDATHLTHLLGPSHSYSRIPSIVTVMILIPLCLSICLVTDVRCLTHHCTLAQRSLTVLIFKLSLSILITKNLFSLSINNFQPLSRYALKYIFGINECHVRYISNLLQVSCSAHNSLFSILYLYYTFLGVYMCDLPE